MEKVRTWIVKNAALFVLILVAAFAYFRWFNFSILNYGDWGFKFADNLRQNLLAPIWISNNGLGSFDVIYFRTPLNFAYGIFGLIGHSLNIADKFLVLWPIVFTGVISSYLLIKEIVKDKWSAVVGSFVFTFNTYFLAINTQGHLLLTLAANVCVFALWRYIKYLNNHKNIEIIYSALILLIAGIYDFRTVYITIIIIILLTIYELLLNRNNLVIIKGLLLLLFFISLLNVYWVLPTAFAGEVSSNGALGRDLFGNQFWNLTDSLLLFHPFWNGSKPTWFLVNSPPIYFFIIPILVTLGALINNKSYKYPFWLLVSLIGVFLSKQVDQPLPIIYTWLYTHLPGFNAFREATKFYYMIAVGYAVLIAGFISALSRNKKIPRNFAIAIGVATSMLFLLNTLPMITGSIETLFVPRKVPKDIADFNVFVNNQRSYFRVYWVPAMPTWADPTNNHPSISGVQIVQNEWLNYTNTNYQSNDAYDKELITDIFSKPYSQYLFSNSAVKYVVVPPKDIVNDDNIYAFYGGDRSYYIDFLDHISFLKRIRFKDSSLIVYENSNFHPGAGIINVVENNHSISNFINNFSFSQSTFGQDFGSVEGPNLPSANLTNVIDPFSLNSSSKSYSLALDTHSVSYYLNTNKWAANYSVRNGNLTILTTRIGADDVNTSANRLTNTVNVTTPLSHAFNYYINSNGIVTPVSYSDGSDLGSPTSLSLLSTQSGNRLQLKEASSVRSGNDCEAGLSGSTTNLKDQIHLQSIDSSDCAISQRINVREGDKFILSAAYSAMGSPYLGYKVLFDSQDKSFIRGEVPTSSRTHDMYLKIDVPSGATHMIVSFVNYPPQDQSKPSISSIQDISLNPIVSDTTLLNDTSPSYIPVTHQVYQSIVNNYDHTLSTNKNLVPNGSFENGPWENQPEDCNAISPTPDIRMSIVKDHTSGNSSVELGAQNDAACTFSRNIPVQSGKSYKLSLDYRVMSGDNAGFSLTFNDPNNKSISRTMSPGDQNWHTYSEVITAPIGATEVDLGIYAVGLDDISAPYSAVRYDNISLVEASPLNDLLYAKSNPIEGHNSAKLEISNDNPTRRPINLTNADGTIFIYLSDDFNKGWILKTKSGGVINSSNHLKLNGYENLWYININSTCLNVRNSCSRNSDGTYNLQLIAYYSPQDWAIIGLIISGLTATCLLTVIVLKRTYGRNGLRIINNRQYH